VRNTLESARGVVPVRLSVTERRRIARAAKAGDLLFSSFVRWAALEAASDQLLGQRPYRKPFIEPGREPIVISSEPEPERRPHFVDGEPVSSPRRVDLQSVDL
jgi:hypothetical protein